MAENRPPPARPDNPPRVPGAHNPSGRLPLSILAIPLGAAVLVLLIALPALHGPLVLDSVKLHSLEALLAQYGNDAIWHTPGFGGAWQRIVAMASFVLNIQASGGLDPAAIRLTNLVIHGLTGLAVFVLTRLLVGAAPQRRWATAAAVGSSVLWLVSPLNFNVALYGVQRMAQLAALFSFAGLACYAAARLQESNTRRALYLGLALLVCLPLAVLSKQNGVLLLPLAFVLEVYWLHPARPWWSGRQLALAGSLGALVALAALLYLYPGVLDYHSRAFTLGERLLSQPRALAGYLQALLAPFGSDIGVYNDDFVAASSLLRPPGTALALLGLLGVIGIAVAGWRGRWRPVAFGLAFFLVGHALESSFIPLELYFPHRNYLPGFGIYFALVAGALTLAPARRWLVTGLVLYSAYFVAIDYARALSWQSRAAMLGAAVHYHPDSPRALSDFAELAVSHGQPALARQAIERAIALRDTLNARLQRLYILCRAGAAIPAGEYQALGAGGARGISIEIAQALDNLLTLYRGGGCPALHIDPLVAALDALAADRAQRQRSPWTISYYADALLYAAGQHARTHRRLQARLDAGHLPSGLYRLELLLDESRDPEARALLDRLQQQFSDRTLHPYQATLQTARERLDKTAR